MDRASIVSLILGSILGSLIGWVISTKIPKTKDYLKIAVIFISIFIFSFIFANDPFKKNIRDVFFHQSQFEKLALQLGKMMEKDEVLTQKFKNLSSEEIQIATRKYSRQGLYWLSEEQMDEWNTFRILFADSSLALCAGLMTGKVDEKIIQQSFEGFSDDQIKRWADLSYAATKAGIINETSFNPDQATIEIGNGINQVTSLLGKVDGSRFQNILEQYETVSDEEACWGTKAIHTTVPKLPSKQRVTFLRALASFGS